MAHWGMEDVQACFGDTADLNTRQITVGGQRLGLLFLDGLTSGGDIAEQVLKPLMETVTPGSIQEVLTQAERARVYCAVAERTQDPAQTADKLLHGYCAVIFPGTDTALCFETKTSARRGPSAPESENTVKGAKDAFTETMRINTSLLRRHLRTAQLRFSQKTVGLRTKTAVTVCYLADLTAPELVRRMEKRLENIDIDGMLTPASVEEYVTGSRRTAFPLLQYTERPDTFCQGLLNGQVGLLVDGLPLGYLAPVNLGVLMKSTEDRAVDYLSASCLRVLRYLALLAALLLPDGSWQRRSFCGCCLRPRALLRPVRSRLKTTLARSCPRSRFCWRRWPDKRDGWQPDVSVQCLRCASRDCMRSLPQHLCGTCRQIGAARRAFQRMPRWRSACVWGRSAWHLSRRRRKHRAFHPVRRQHLRFFRQSRHF